MAVLDDKLISDSRATEGNASALLLCYWSWPGSSLMHLTSGVGYRFLRAELSSTLLAFPSLYVVNPNK